MIKNQNLYPVSPLKASKLKIKRPTPIKVATRYPNSRKHAIFAKCWDCCGGQYENTPFDSEVKKSIKYCSMTSCLLHPFRNYKTKKPVSFFGEYITGLELLYLKLNSTRNLS